MAPFWRNARRGVKFRIDRALPEPPFRTRVLFLKGFAKHMKKMLSVIPAGAQSDYSAEQNEMIEHQLVARGVRDEAVLSAMRSVPRDRFVPSRLRASAYEDVPLPIGENQTISQPYIVAVMIEAAQLSNASRVLEIGAGSGYAAAVMSRIARRVYAVERHGTLARGARRRLKALGFRNIEIKTSDGTLGWPEHAPYDAILVAAAGAFIPPKLQQQVAIGGCLIMPVGSSGSGQSLRKMIRTGERSWLEEDLGNVLFVPLISEQTEPQSG